jgi:sentrin-specific protease 1
VGTLSTHSFPSCDPDRLCRAPPEFSLVHSFEQLNLSRKASDEEIDRSLIPKKAPLPSYLPPEDEAYVDAILTKCGAISRAGRERVADKDIACLRPHEWLNDEIINFYGQLILSRSESQNEDSTSTPAGGHTKEFVIDIKDRGKGKAGVVEKKCLDVHYFSTFFWPKLHGDGYDKGRLAKWTKKVRTFNRNSSTYRSLILCFS